MIATNEVQDILRTTKSWQDTLQARWEMMGGAYSDRYWTSLTGTRDVDIFTRQLPAVEARKTKVEVNLIKPWTQGFLASLYYDGVQFSVLPDPLEEKKPLDDEKVEAVGVLVNNFFRQSDVGMAATQAFKVGLLYEGTGGFKVGVDSEEEDPVASVWIEAILPWELVFDRSARSVRAMRYRGYLRMVPREEYEGQFGAVEKDKLVTLAPAVDVIDGTTIRADLKDHVRLFELHDLTEKRGRLRFFVVGASMEAEEVYPKEPVGDAKKPENKANNRELEMPRRADGRPMDLLFPLVVDSPPDAPMYNLAPGLALYRLNSEMNFLISDMATGYRRTMGRLLLYLKSKGIDEKVLAAWEAGDDQAAVGVETTEKLADLMAFVPQQPVHDGVLKYREMLERAIPSVQLTAGMTRGTPGQYLSATEVQFLSSYTETMIGMMRQASDVVLANVAATVLKLIASRVKSKGIRVALTDRTVVTLSKEDLSRRWLFTMADGATTPMANNQRKLELSQLSPLLVQLLDLATNMERPDLAGAAAALYDHIAKVYGFPDRMQWANLPKDNGREQPTPPEEPAPAPAPEPGTPPADAGAGPGAPVVDDPALLETPLGQVAAAAAQGG